MVDPVAGGDVDVRLADEFSVLVDFIAFGEIDQRDLVAIGNVFFCFDGFYCIAVTVCDGLAFCDLTDTGHDVVFRVDQDCVDHHNSHLFLSLLYRRRCI